MQDAQKGDRLILNDKASGHGMHSELKSDLVRQVMMPMSPRAYNALKAAAEWNPSAAKFLWFLVKETPEVVVYKDDLYGPLTLLLILDVVDKPIFHDLNAPIDPGDVRIRNHLMVPAKLPPFPQEKLADCKVFGDEWKARKFTKKELAEILEQILAELP
ncbi:MAG TPA: hypothetical protein VLG46_10465 [Anaerolineae bacterium]|nr:hypothetical protein [Anaerolineae bacterium]